MQVQEFLLPQEVLLGEELQLLGVVQGAAAGWVQGRPEGWHRSPLHQLRWGQGDSEAALPPGAHHPTLQMGKLRQSWAQLGLQLLPGDG